jgi:tRNA(Ile)-lysidine synthase
MLEQICFILQHNCAIVTDKLVVIGVSGGPDSLCLLDAVWRLGYPVLVAHFNHRLRPQADDEARQVEEQARQRGLAFVLGSQDVAAFARQKRLSLEEAGRVLRYRFLFAQAEQHGAQAVAVGHTADDQVETLLMHLLRGAGLAGLSGMAYRALPNPWSSRIPLVRPLLGIWREQILAYVQENGLQPVWDASNLDSAFYRNRLRHELIPFLERYNPAVRRLLWRTAEVLQQEAQVLERLVDQAWPLCVPRQGQNHLALDRQALMAQPVALQRRLLRRAMLTLRPDLRDLDFEAIQRGLAFMAAGARGECHLTGGLRLLSEGDQWWLLGAKADLPQADWPQLPTAAALEVPLPGVLSLPHGWVLRAEVLPRAEVSEAAIFANPDPFQVWLDAEALTLPLRLRQRRPGERFRPLGMGGHSLKVSDLMVNLKIPRRARSAWPLVCAGDEVVWLPGYRPAETARVTEKTRRLVHLHLVRSHPRL